MSWLMEPNPLYARFSSAKKTAVYGLLKIYLTTIAQILLFVLMLSAAFFAGVVEYTGGYIIPMIDKGMFIGNLMLYITVSLGTVIILRYLIMTVLVGIHFREELFRNTKLGFSVNYLFILCIPLIFIAVLYVFIDAITALIMVSKYKFLAICIIIAIVAFCAYVWWSTKNALIARAYIFMSMCLGLTLFFLAGSLFMQYQLEHEPDFSIVHGTPEKETEVNIIYKSPDGVLAVDKDLRMPVFFPWQQVSVIKISPSRRREIEERKRLQRLGFAAFKARVTKKISNFIDCGI